MKAVVTALFLLTAAAVPLENKEKGTPPDTTSAQTGAALLLDAIQTNTPQKAESFFFPKEAFDEVKDHPKPERYHRKLLLWFEEDIQKEYPRFKSGDWQLVAFELGRCKWKEIGTEQNKVAYWSCTRNFVTAKSGEKTKRLEIRVLINWGNTWYVTHLGPIR